MKYDVSNILMIYSMNGAIERIGLKDILSQYKQVIENITLVYLPMLLGSN